MGKNRKHKLNRSVKSGLPPGTLVHIGAEKQHDAEISVIEYNSSEIREYSVESFMDCPDSGKDGLTVWININGVHETDLVQELEKKYGIHPLVLEDIVNTIQRPKFEDYESYYYIVLKKLQSHGREIQKEQISLILLPGIVISFQENKKKDTFENIKSRLKNNRGKIRSYWSDFLLYSLLDTVVDQYFAVLEELGEQIDEIEHETETDPDSGTLRLIHQLKREVISFRKSVWPLREVIAAIERNTGTFVTSSTKVYLRDVYDHVINLLDMMETYRDLLSSLFDVYLSTISNKTNEVMKVLTVTGTIFIPLTFLTGLYGMNFKNMPELDWKYGYFLILSLMLGLAGGMVMYFRKKNWF